ncbi:phosphatidylinositol 4-phosphate 5-kinase type-1 beta-like [Myzus persicae]|uniref:phosphatidylinositol 4-phosphate 5-kinase type-1 beta-like n=1 Tax=Myzus persicae TaxID=13164 RepID=UPI000B939420|nr:phosphatidylinositol 4-phosphate 5-kinase type-1 beta-like [Myzus persicae]
MMIKKSTFSIYFIIFLEYNKIISTVTCYCKDCSDSYPDFGDVNEKIHNGSEQGDHQAKEKEKEFGQEKAVDENVEITCDAQTVQIMNSIQLGIQEAVTKNDSNVICSSEFRFTESLDTELIDLKKNYQLSDNEGYKFYTYAPSTFHYFRDFFGIQLNEYVGSLCKSPLIVVSNSGASTSIFYLTQDRKFIIKSLQKDEDECLNKLLNRYITHLKLNSESLLPKFSGFYRYKSKLIDIKLVSMNNLLPSNIKMQVKYDLKGSTFNRTASRNEKLKPSPTLKDLDFDEDDLDGLFLMPHTLSDLLKTINSDCDFLKNCNIMDYSLLLGIHKLDEDISTCSQAASARFNRLMVNSIGMQDIQADTATFENEKPCPFLRGSIPAISGSDKKLLLFVGIIDILQDYGIMKRIENMYKTLKIWLTVCIPSDLSSISAKPPKKYAFRFMEFMKNSVFKPYLSSREREEQSKQQSVEIVLGK